MTLPLVITNLFAGILCMLVSVSAFAGEQKWQPEKTWVFMVGVLEWKHGEMYNPYPKKSRRDAELMRFFKAKGVPAAQIVYLQDKEATAQRIQDVFTVHLAKAREGDFLFLYYGGHGDGESNPQNVHFVSYDAGDGGIQGWPVNSIPVTIEHCFRGSRAFLTADCCYSGTLAEAVRRHKGRISYACLTSASANQNSTENWTFTETLLAGLRGDSYFDANNDGQITLKELAHQAEEDMSFVEEQSASFVTTGIFSPMMILTNARKKSSARVGERVEVKSGPLWYGARIIDVKDTKFKVRYYGEYLSSDEWVEVDRVRAPKPARYEIGEIVEVRRNGRWCSAKILKDRDGVYLVHYFSLGDEWDSWVGWRQIRRVRS